MSMEGINGPLFQLPPKDFLSLADVIEERAETLAMLQLAETGFREWNEEGEGI